MSGFDYRHCAITLVGDIAGVGAQVDSYLPWFLPTVKAEFMLAWVVRGRSGEVGIDPTTHTAYVTADTDGGIGYVIDTLRDRRLWRTSVILCSGLGVLL
ncbi:hypothetical protein ABZW96_33070 [Nocardia sp. NPDC004168]|uniref:hypothetical protein n=1 Tax=Nocardia sp. NPDC004168 TaxID=3154452 RepID=UPI0033BF2927